MRYLINLLLCSVVVYSTNGVSANLVLDLQACKKIIQSELRLTCYDDLANKQVQYKSEKIASKASTKPANIKANVAPVASSSVAEVVKVAPAKTTVVKAPVKIKTLSQQEDAFGKEQIKKTKAERKEILETLTLKIQQIKKLSRGKWRITFENGQQWQQSDSTKLKLKVGDIVILEKGMFNAVYLNKKGNNKRIKVKRIK